MDLENKDIQCECETIMKLEEGVYVCPSCENSLTEAEALDKFNEGDLIIVESEETIDAKLSALLEEKGELSDGELATFCEENDVDVTNVDMKVLLSKVNEANTDTTKETIDSIMEDTQLEFDINDKLVELGKKNDYSLSESDVMVFCQNNDTDLEGVDLTKLTESINADLVSYKNVDAKLISALTESEDFDKETVNTLMETFNSAVTLQVESIKTSLQESYNELLESAKEELLDNVDAFLESEVQKWVDENEILIDESIEIEKSKAFMIGVKDLFESNYISVDNEKTDLVKEMANEITSLNTKLTESKNELSEFKADVDTVAKSTILKELSESLTDIDAEKLATISKEVEFVSESDFQTKLEKLKNTFFKSTKIVTENVDADLIEEEVDYKDQSDSNMAQVLKMLSK